jgi:hypothetical protein
LEGDERFSWRIKHSFRKQLGSVWLKREQKLHLMRSGVEEMDLGVVGCLRCDLDEVDIRGPADEEPEMPEMLEVI